MKIWTIKQSRKYSTTNLDFIPMLLYLGHIVSLPNNVKQKAIEQISKFASPLATSGAMSLKFSLYKLYMLL